MQLTKEQGKIVDAPVCNLLVSAAAGSGKTTVMVEHILHLLCDVKNPINLDDMLIVTFTEAAAASMKNKINETLAKKITEDPDNAAIYREQLRRLPLAQISTIDSFLLGVVQDNITELPELDSNLRMMDSAEEKLLFQEVLSDCLENHYLEAENNPTTQKAVSFKGFVNFFSDLKDDTAIEEYIKTVYYKIMNFSSPFVFLKNSVARYNDPINNFKSLIISAEKQSIQKLKLKADVLYNDVNTFAVGKEENITDYSLKVDYLNNLFQQAELILDDEEPNLSAYFGLFKYDLPGKSNIQHKIFEDPQIKEDTSKIWKQIKTIFNDNLTKSELFANPELHKESYQSLYNALIGLQDFIIDLNDDYTKEKSRKNVVSFNDVNHYALKLLFDDEECTTRSKTALAYQKQYKAVFVDEYQDVNDMQNKVIEAVSSDYNLFMVGDVKQSIYRFRSSLPELFLGKLKQYPNNENPIAGQNNSLVLNKNFRSHPDILSVTNQFFKYLMNLDGNELFYTDDVALNAGLKLDDFSSDPHAHVQLVSVIQDLDTKDPNAEAKWIAQDIKQKLDNGYEIFDLHKKRPLELNDIVILKRNSTNLDLISQELNKLGIPSVRDRGYNFFDAPEIQPLLALLKVLDNPLNNVELINVLHSPIFNFKAQDLAEIRLLNNKESIYYHLLCKAAETNGFSLQKKCQDTYEVLNDWIKAAKYLSIHDLLVKIYRESNLYLYFKAAPLGNLRAKNLDLLLEKSMAFEKTIFNGLYSFINYLEMNKRYEETIDEASMVEEGQSAVRLMTIHKSKGLEFPLVYLTGLKGKENDNDKKSGVLIDRNVGIAINPTKNKEKDKFKLFFDYQNNAIETSALSERECILYVAMTRAIDTLIMVGEDDEKDESGELNAVALQGLNNYMSWIKNTCAQNSISNLDFKQVKTSELNTNISIVLDKPFIDPPTSEILPQNSLLTHLEWKYPHSKETGLKVRFSVSEIKKAQEHTENEQEIPEPVVDFFSDEGEKENNGALKGTMFHLFLANADFSMLQEDDQIQKQLQMMIQSNLLTKEEAENYLDLEKIKLFGKSELCQRLIHSSKIYKEQPFLLSLSISELRSICPTWPYLQLGDNDTQVMLQGIIDCFFVEDDKVVLIDYKTDKQLSPERIAMYTTQLKIYEKALEKGQFGTIKEKALYWAHDGKLYHV